MRQFWVFLFLAAGFWGGYCFHNAGEPYQLDYQRAVINLPITFTKYLDDKQYALGEKYLAEDLAEELKRQGIDTRLYTFEDTFSNRGFNEGYEIYMRPGPELRLDPSYHSFAGKDRIAVLFETIPYEFNEVKNADIVLTGSLKKNREYREAGINSYFLPQFTRTDKFYYDPREELRKKVLFVANQWPDMGTRKSVDYAIKSGVELEVFGDNWENALYDSYASWWKARQIPNDQLKYFYSSADIVLNDTRPDMIEAGVISNRIFDATASKAFVISDYMPEIEEIYGDSIPMYKNEAEFKKLIEYYLAHPEERRQKAEQAYKITTSRFAASTVIKEIVRILNDYRKEKGFGEKQIWRQRL